MTNFTHAYSVNAGGEYVYVLETDTPGQWIEAVNPVEVLQ